MLDDEELTTKKNNKTDEVIPEEVGSVKIADEVLSIVAGLAAS